MKSFVKPSIRCMALLCVTLGVPSAQLAEAQSAVQL